MALDLPTCRIGGLSPLLMPITGNPVSKNGLASTQGIAVTIGQPGQFFSLRPASQQNNTFVTSADRCVSAQNYTCIATQGGVYTPSGSEYSTNSEGSWNGTKGDAEDGFRTVFYNDFFQVAGHGIPGMPFFAYVNEATGDTNPSVLGMGANSSFLDTLLANKVVGTKQWSLWPGSLESRLSDNEDGLLIVGGYDAALVGSSFTTMPMNNAKRATLYAEITGLSWQNATSTTNLMPPGYSTLLSGLDPSSDGIENFPASSAALLGAATGYNASSSGYYYGSSVPVGNLTVTLSSGVITVIPAENLFRRLSNYSSTGQVQETSTTRYATWAYVNQVPDAWPTYQYLTLGLPFLTQHLLVVDPDQDSYSLADIVRSKAGSKVNDLKPLCTGGPISANTSTTNTTNTTSTAHSSGTNVAAIGGGVGGGIGAILIIALIFLLYKRHTRRSNAQAQHSSEHGQIGTHQQPEVVAVQRMSMGSPPPKYVQAKVYGEQGLSPHQQYQTYEDRWSHQSHTELESNATMSPRSDGGLGYANSDRGFHGRYSQAGTHEINGENFHATSGPIEMPANQARH